MKRFVSPRIGEALIITIWALGLLSTLLTTSLLTLALIGGVSLIYHLARSRRRSMMHIARLAALGGSMVAIATWWSAVTPPWDVLLFLLARIAIAGSWTFGLVDSLRISDLRRRLNGLRWCRPVAEHLDTTILHGTILADQWRRRHDAARQRCARWRGPAALNTIGKILGYGSLMALERSIALEEARELRCARAQLTPSDNAPILDARHLTVRHDRRGPDNLHNLDFVVHPGEWLALIGASGSGKTSLLRALCGLAHLGSGVLERFGEPVQGPRAIPDGRISMVFQDPSHQLLGVTARDDLMWGLRQQGITDQEACRRVDRLLDGLQLSALADQPIYQLSLGQQRLVSLASALITAPRLLLCDEITSGLDPNNAARAVELVDTTRRRGTTVIWVTHDLHHLPPAIDRVMVLGEKTIQFDGPRHRALSQEILKAASLTTSIQFDVSPTTELPDE